MKNKKIRLFVVLGILIILGIMSVFAISKLKNKTQVVEETKTKKKLSLPEASLEEAPYVLIEPVDSKNLVIEVKSLKKSADEMDYELEYQAGSLLQGAFGLVELGNLPASEKVLLGSCSAGGACTYHTDVKGGNFLGRFTGSENYQKKADWKYIENKTHETEFSSKDAKFQIVSKDLKNNSLLIIFNGLGYPDGLNKTVDSDPYALTSSNTLSGSAELTIRANSEEATTIMGYDGKSWHEFETAKDGKMLTATVDLMELYLAVK